MWAYESVFYQIYPLGLCGAPRENPPGGAPAPENRLPRIAAFLPHMRALGINALYLGPVFYADRHGYDTRDYRRIDPRLGTNRDFAALCAALHESGIRVVLDGVFHHVGRGFWAFQDLLKNRECSRYQDWFAGVNFGGNNRYGDGLWYEGWEGHDELVKQTSRTRKSSATCSAAWRTGSGSSASTGCGSTSPTACQKASSPAFAASATRGSRISSSSARWCTGITAA